MKGELEAVRLCLYMVILGIKNEKALGPVMRKAKCQPIESQSYLQKGRREIGEEEKQVAQERRTTRKCAQH